MNSFSLFLDEIVEPTFIDFERNPGSERHAYLACVAAFHAVERFPGWRAKRIRKQWQSESLEFLLVDLACHRLKHGHSDIEDQPPKQPGLPIAFSVFGAESICRGKMDTRNLYFVVRDAIAFLRSKAAEADPVD